ncbi:hypothetical protein KW882_04855 [Vibrio parahaemolyticus]
MKSKKNKCFPIYGYLSPKHLAMNYDAWVKVTKIQQICVITFLVAPALSFVWIKLDLHNEVKLGREFGLFLLHTGIVSLVIGFVASLLMIAAVDIVEADHS